MFDGFFLRFENFQHRSRLIYADRFGNFMDVAVYEFYIGVYYKLIFDGRNSFYPKFLLVCRRCGIVLEENEMPFL